MTFIYFQKLGGLGSRWVILDEMSSSVPFSVMRSVPVAKHPVSHCKAAVKGPFCLSLSVYTCQICCLSFGGPSMKSMCAPHLRVSVCATVSMYTCTLLIFVFPYVCLHKHRGVTQSSDLSIQDDVWENCVLFLDSSVSLTLAQPFTPPLSQLCRSSVQEQDMKAFIDILIIFKSSHCRNFNYDHNKSQSCVFLSPPKSNCLEKCRVVFISVVRRYKVRSGSRLIEKTWDLFCFSISPFCSAFHNLAKRTQQDQSMHKMHQI